MRLETASDALSRGVRLVRPAFRNPGSVVSAVLAASGDQLALTATGRTMTIRTNVRAHVHDSGSVAVPARLFADIINRAPAETVSLATADKDLAIASGGLSASLRVLEGQPPPEIETTATVPTSTMTGDEARRAAALSTAASKDAQRPVLTGVHLGSGRAEATDSYRAARTPLGGWCLSRA